MLQPLFPTRPWLWFGRLALLGLLLLTAAGGAGVGLLLALIDEAPPYEEFEDFSPALVSRVVDHTGEETVAQFYIERREFVSLDQIPWRLINAFLAIEDERFFHHVGVDPHGIAAAVFSSVVHGSRLRGASTLTMQLARKTLEEISDERLIERKIREALAALQIESRYTKEQILEFYLNQIPLGNGLYGVQAAARAYFGVGIDDLTIAQCATIAGIAKLPERFNPRDALANAARGRPFYYGRGPDDATARRNIVLGNMRDLGLISDEEYLLARSEPMRLGSPPDRGNRAPYFIDLVRRQILADPDLGYDTLFEGGVVIHSTVDLELQALAERTLSAGLVSAEALWQSRKIERLWDEEEPDNFGWRVDEGEQRLVRIAEVTETGLILELNGFVGDAPLPARLPHFDPSSIIQPGNLIEVVILETDGGQRTFRARVVDDSHVQGALVLIDVPTGEIRALVGGENWSDDHAAGQYNRAILGGRQPGSCFKPFVFAEALEQGMAPNRMFNDERVEFHTPGSEPYVPRNFENRHFGPTTLVEALEHSRNV
ncbi:transglycosylase domain-containing protein, partial [Candidatus Sumerlaeota bacterium]|nr:transglycosylase domain-containing protein [Candidatus Sumerlaeota bacterium]